MPLGGVNDCIEELALNGALEEARNFTEGLKRGGIDARKDEYCIVTVSYREHGALWLFRMTVDSRTDSWIGRNRNQNLNQNRDLIRAVRNGDGGSLQKQGGKYELILASNVVV